MDPLPPPRLALVTGANGFIGRTLCSHLQSHGIRVRALLRRPATGPWEESAPGELGGEYPLEGALEGVDTLFHLAALVHSRATGPAMAARYQSINVTGTRRLLEAAHAAGTRRAILVSSVKAMGEGGDHPQDETTPPRPLTPYGLSKLQAEELLLNSPLPHVCVVRLPLVYGPGNKGNLNRMLEAVRRGLFPPLPETGNRRTMIHVADVAEALLLAATSPAAHGEVFLLGDGIPYSTRAILEAMRQTLGRPPLGWSLPWGVLRRAARLGDGLGRLTGRRFPLDSESLDKLLGSAWYDVDKARRVLGFTPRHTLWDTLPLMARQE